MQILGSVYLFIYLSKNYCVQKQFFCFFSFVGIRHQTIYILNEDAALLLPSLGGP